MYTKDELKGYSGEMSYERAPRAPYRELRFQGKKGIFLFNYKEGEEWKTEEIGSDPVNVVILRVRRRLTNIDKNWATNEHTHSGEEVVLWKEVDGRKLRELGIAKQLKEVYGKDLNAEQILYVLYNDEICIMRIKGASLGLINQPHKNVGLYEYFGTYKREKDEHLWMFETIISFTEEKGPKGKYFALSFERGEEISDFEKVGDSMKEIDVLVKSMDNYYKNSLVAYKGMPAQISAPKKEEITDQDIIEVTDDIKPEDLPF